MENVKNPIIIDQDYCDKSKCTEQVRLNLIKSSITKRHDNKNFSLIIYYIFSEISGPNQERGLPEHKRHKRIGHSNNFQLQQELSMPRNCTRQSEH